MPKLKNFEETEIKIEIVLEFGVMKLKGNE